jgi:hypothetical protein
LSCPSSFGHSIFLSFFFWSLHCLVLLLLVILLSCPSSFCYCIVLSFFFLSLYCLVLLLFVKKKKDKTMQWQKEEGQDNTMTKRRRTRQYNDKKKKDKTIEWPKEKRLRQ